jgi:hypothetical protein
MIERDDNVEDIENYNKTKGGYFLMALMIGVVLSKYPELSAKYDDKDSFIRYTKEMGDFNRTDGTVKERVPMH